MKTIFLCVMVWFCGSCLASAQQTAFETKQLPDAWIAKLRKFNFKTSPNDLVREFESAIAPNKIMPFEKDALLNVTFVNLDEDESEEILLLIGGENQNWKYDHNICVIKQVNKKWTLIHSEQLKHTSPTIHIASKLTPTKIFYVSQKGDGILGPYSGWREDIRIYKILDGKVQHCLTVLDVLDFHITPWHAHQEVNTTVHISESSVWVAYHYNFMVRLAQDEFALTSLIHGRVAIEYIWDRETKQYLPQYHDEINAEKIAALEGKADFFQPFHKELDDIKKHGSEQQKHAYEQFLDERSKH